MRNFQDLVSLSGSGPTTLVYRDGALQMGNTTVSTVKLDLVNSGGTLELRAAPTGNGTVNFPTSGGTLLTNINVSGGTTSSNVSAVTFSNANGVTFGFDGTNISASIATSLTNINVSAGTTSNNLSAVVFSNSNGVSFGLNGSTVTGSVATSLTNINVSAGTTSRNLSAVVFSNSNGVSFGLNGSTVTGSVATSLTNINVSAGTTSSNVSAVTFSNANNVSFGYDGTNVTASASVATSAAAVGGLSSFQALQPVVTQQPRTASMSLCPVAIPYNLTVTQLVYLQSQSNSTVTATYTVSMGLYTVKTATGGVSNWTLSKASSQTTTLSVNNGISTGVSYMTLTVASWNITPGLYVLAFAQNNSVNSIFMDASNPGAITNGADLQSMILSGIWNAATLPASIAVSDTGSYIRSGNSVGNQPWLMLQGS